MIYNSHPQLDGLHKLTSQGPSQIACTALISAVGLIRAGNSCVASTATCYPEGIF